MAHVKSTGTAKNVGQKARPKYLGIKIQDGGSVRPGMIIVRQRGINFLPGDNVGMGKDFTLFARGEGVVKFSEKRKKKFNNRIEKKKVVSIRTKQP